MTDTAKPAETAAWRQVLLSRNDIERDYGLKRRWLELAAMTANGPPMIRFSSRMIRYQRGAFEDWLAARVVSSSKQLLGTYK